MQQTGSHRPPETRRRRCRIVAGPLLACSVLAGCVGIGPNRLSHDQIDFSRALAVADNQQTLLNIVRLRYAEAPTFLALTQVISGYQTQQNVSGSFELFPNYHPSTYFGAGGAVQLQESPTFTYAPVTGDQFADTFLRPLPPGTALSLALTGAPIDLLLELVAQSIDEMDNAEVLDGDGGAPSLRFRTLLHDLRLLQVAGLLDLRIGQTAPTAMTRDRATRDGPDRKGVATIAGAPAIGIRSGGGPALRAAAAEARQLLGMAPGEDAPLDLVYGRQQANPGQVSVLTRSILGVLTAAAFGIEVPAGDIVDGRTIATIRTASPIVIRSGRSAPADAFVAINYDDTWFWISGRDFRSKLAFAVLQTLLALAQTKTAPGAVVTIPAA